MTRLCIHPEGRYQADAVSIGIRGEIARELQRLGIRYEHHGVVSLIGRKARGVLNDGGEAVLTAYAELIERQKLEHGYSVVDAVTVTSHTPDIRAVRGKFLSEHTHAEDEARFMVDGAGTFYLRQGGQVLILELTAGDLISVPAGMRHWFDMGERPHFTAIRFFTRPDGWVGSFTGDPIAERFPLYAGAVA